MLGSTRPRYFVCGGVVLVLAIMLHRGSAIKCWECNSRYNPDCADPFNNYTFALTDCTQRTLEHMGAANATVCRKIIQKVNDEYRYIRTCGWIDSETDGTECMKRAGTFSVLINYCSCTTDGCNGAQGLSLSTLSLGGAVVASLIVSRFLPMLQK